MIKAMKERRSIRKFRPEMPEKEAIDQILEAGLYAANGMGRQAVIRSRRTTVPSAAGRRASILSMVLR